MTNNYTLYHGDCLDILPTLPEASVQCVVTSPPYYGLRDYGHEAQIGLEQTPEKYVAKLVAVFREVRRVLRDDGVCFLNLGDSYGTGASGQNFDPASGATNSGGQGAAGTFGHKKQAPVRGFYKQLLGIPWRVAFALQADGWWLRSDIIWHKPNPMPESVTDRPTKSHEYVFLLTKSARYFYDAEGVKEGSVDPQGSAARYQYTFGGPATAALGQYGKTRPDGYRQFEPTRNRRTVWTIATQPYSGAHFATMPPALAEVCIKAGTSERGCCPACGAPWERVIKVVGKLPKQKWGKIKPETGDQYAVGPMDRGGNSQYQNGGIVTGEYLDKRTTGWQPTCACDAGEPVPCIVLDPFMGSGTTGQVAAHLGQRFIGIELNAEYLELARQRVGNPYDDFVMTDKERTSGQLPLFEGMA